MEILNTAEKDDRIKNLQKDIPKNLICFSHLRWDFVFQRPQHLMTRLSEFSIFFIEEPIFDAVGTDHYTCLNRGDHLRIVIPHLRPGLDPESIKHAQEVLFDAFMENRLLEDYIFWYYTPMALEFSRKYSPELTVFDCMDELSAFKFAPENLKVLEKELLKKADIVFTGGASIYEAKKNQHANIFVFPSSIDKGHFAKARQMLKSKSGHVRLGFFGVIDERFDGELIRQLAQADPRWQIFLIGPIVKIDPLSLPQNKNIFYLGAKTYQELPEYIADWDIALIPFLLNDSTRYISPTKTPEYLAAGKPVVSTAIRDVISPYGEQKLVHIAYNPGEFIEAVKKELRSADKKSWLQKVDSFLALTSWDKTKNEILQLMTDTVQNKAITFLA